MEEYDYVVDTIFGSNWMYDDAVRVEILTFFFSSLENSGEIPID
jgi:hypothetical protein